MRRRDAALFLVSLGLIAVLTRTGPTSAHEWARLGTVESIVERTTLQLDGSKFRGTRDRVLSDGHWYSHQPPLLALLESPVYWVLHAFGLRFSNNAVVDPAFYLFTLLTNGVAFAVTVVVFDRILLMLAPALRWRAPFALLLPLGTWLLPYAVVPNNHGISAALLMLMAWQLLLIGESGITVWRARWLGIVLGLLCAIEVLPVVSLVPAMAWWGWQRRAQLDRSSMRAFAAGLAMPIVAHGLLNMTVTGDWMPAGFHAELFVYEGSTFDAASLSGSWKHATVGSFMRYAAEALFTHKGYVTLAPVLAAGAFAFLVRWPVLSRHGDTLLALFVGTSLSLLAALLTTNNLGGVAVGFRHATYLAAAFLVLLAPALGGRSAPAVAWSSAILVIAAASMVIHVVYTVPQPWSDLQLPIW